jgi:cobalt-zinc-cadmium efflux system outer membrane protein
MSIRRAALVAAVVLLAGPARAQDSRVLTLEAAFARTLEKHPALSRFDHLRAGARAALEGGGLRPPLRVELEVENAPRSGQRSSLDSAETTLGLASVLERGGKNAARVAVAQAQLDALTLQEQQARIDLLAEVARRYLDLVAAQSLEQLASAELAQREQIVHATAQRVRAGATPESIRLAAEAALANAALQRERLRAQARAAALRLTLLWNGGEPDFDRGVGDPLSLPQTPSLQALRELLQRSPELRRFADESRVREARLQLARSARVWDIEWRAGVRRLEEDGSWAAVFGLSVPLGTARRAEPGVRAAQAELAVLSLERESEALSLEATLVEAHLRLTAASSEVAAARESLLPKLAQAERASERAFRAGALTYGEWAQVQGDAMTARREQLLAAVEAHRALIEIQRLTGSSFTESAPETSRNSP